MKVYLEKVSSGICASFLYLFGNFDLLLKTIITLFFLDYITGVCKAFIQKKVNSSIGAKGIIKKVAYLCIITVSVLLDLILNTGGQLRALVITSFIFNEIFSILENCSDIGIKIPSVLYNSLGKLNQEKSTNKKD